MTSAVASISPTTSSKTTSNVFVYGTLKRGMFNHKLIQNEKFIGIAQTTNHYKYSLVLSKWGFPYLLETNEEKMGSLAIKGELYEVSDEVLELLDELENIKGGLYQRKVIDVLLADCLTTMKCFAYIAGEKENKSNLPTIEEYTQEIHDMKYISKLDRSRE
jgi:gamma-glutamylaminecyclotransferase